VVSKYCPIIGGGRVIVLDETKVKYSPKIIMAHAQQAQEEVKMSCFCSLPASTFETQEF